MAIVVDRSAIQRTRLREPRRDAAFDPLFAAYADAPAGPALEKFTRPSAEDLRYMALARLGLSAVPTLPCEFFTHNSRSEQFATAFGAAGRTAFR